jgi:hypothetical protein
MRGGYNGEVILCCEQLREEVAFLDVGGEVEAAVLEDGADEGAVPISGRRSKRCS